MAQRYTNSSLNDKCKVRYAIFSQPHWFGQLQTAENIISDRSEVIKKNQILLKKNLALIEIRQRKIDPDPEESIELQADVALAELEATKFEGLLRDAEMELQVAQEARQLILEQHPEVAQMNYDQLQEQYTPQAFAANLAKNVAIDSLSKQTKLPPGLVNCLLSVSPEQLQQVVTNYQGYFQKFEHRSQFFAPQDGIEPHSDSASDSNSLPVSQPD